MRLVRHIKRDERGAAIVEFALVAPTMLLMVMGLFELGHTMYVQSIVNGALQEAARDSTIENANIGQITADARDRMRRVSPRATITFTRSNFGEYAEYEKLEDFVDANGDGRCNNGEAFEDLNDSGKRDRAKGLNGQGNARDVVLLQATVNYPRLLPMPGLAGWSSRNTVVGSTMIRNQPFKQKERPVKVRNCMG